MGIGVDVETVVPADHAANGAAETTINVLRRLAGVFVTQIEKALGIGMTIGSMHPLYSWSLVHAAWIHNRFTVRHGQTPYELCSSRMYTGKIALFGEAVLGYLRTSQKAAPCWTRGLWLGKALNNDAHVIGVPGGKVFVTRSIRRFSESWDAKLIADFEACTWEYGLAALGSQLVAAKRITGPQPSTPVPFAVAYPDDHEALAVHGIPGTPEQDEGILLGPQTMLRRSLPPPPQAVAAEAGQEAHAGDVTMAETPRAVVPSTPLDSQGLDVPSTPRADISEHVHDALESDRPSKAPRILAIQGVDHEDEDPPIVLQTSDLDELEAYDYNLVDECEDGEDMLISENVSDLHVLCMPYTPLEPELSASELSKLDALADKMELDRLQAMGVLLPVESLMDQHTSSDSTSCFKKLSTRMVRSWRDKGINGERVWLRRSGYVAREFAWLTPERQDLFSPASSTLTVRLLPVLFLKFVCKGFVLCAIDIGDAYLTVPQKVPTVVSYTDNDGKRVEFSLGRVLPGRRDGALLWHESITNFLWQEMGIGCCEAYPSLLRSECGACMMLLHVDDILCLCTQQFLSDVLRPTLERKYKVAIEVMQTPGDEITFLKFMDESNMLIESHPKHIEHVLDLLNIRRHFQPKKTPAHPELDANDVTHELDAEQAGIYRSAVGTLLYIAPDFPDCQFTIRALAQWMAKPTVHAFNCLKYFAGYLLGCTNHCLQLTFRPQHGSYNYYGDLMVLEVFCDSDWASNKRTRKSVSSCCMMLHGCLLHSSSRTQRTIALSSGEAETYAATSGGCDAVLLRECLLFLFPSGELEVRLFIDSSACRSILQRQGVGKVRHLSTRCLWMQQFCKRGVFSVHPIGTKLNVSDIGTKRHPRPRMLYLMFLLGVYDQGCSQRVGSETYDRLTSETLIASSVNQLRATGLPTGTCKSLLRVLLVSALSPMADAMGLSSKTSPVVVLLLTMLVIAFGVIFWLGLRVHRLQGSLNMKSTLLEVMKVLHDNLKLKDLEGEESEESSDDEMEESPNARRQRYQNAEDMSQVSDPDEWCEMHYGPRFDDYGVERELGEMHAALRTRLERLEREWEEAQTLNDLETMRQLELQIMEISAMLPRNS